MNDCWRLSSGIFAGSTLICSSVFAEHYEEIRSMIGAAPAGSRSRQLLLGAYFTMDYALESVALFNPSIVPAILQEDVPPVRSGF